MTNGNDSAFTNAVPFDEVGNAYPVGLTKREYFAGEAMKAISDAFNPHSEQDRLVLRSIQLADRLIAGLNRPMCPHCKVRFADDGHYLVIEDICPDYERAISE